MKSLNASIEWYQRMGFTADKAKPGAMKLGETLLHLQEKAAATPSYFTVPVKDIVKTKAALHDAHAHQISATQVSGPARYFTIRDPSGNHVEFLQNP